MGAAKKKFEPDFKYPNYTAEEHETWALLYDRQQKLLPNRACPEYLAGLKKLGFDPKRLPALKDVDAVLAKCTNWHLHRVEGLVPEKEFFEMLAQRIFPATDFIRKRDELNYTPAPDMFHDLFGHTSMITDPDFADFFQMMGQIGAKAKGEQLAEVQRIYWFTVEFGLIHTPQGLRIYGSGILSSPGEVVYCLSGKPKVHEFDLEKIIHQSFDIWHMQEELFAIHSFEQLKNEFGRYGRSSGLY